MTRWNSHPSKSISAGAFASPSQGFRAAVEAAWVVSHLTGKRSSDNLLIHELRARDRHAGISTDSYHSYKNAIRDAFGNRAAHCTGTKISSVTHLGVPKTSPRYDLVNLTGQEKGFSKTGRRV